MAARVQGRAVEDIGASLDEGHRGSRYLAKRDSELKDLSWALLNGSTVPLKGFAVPGRLTQGRLGVVTGI